MSFTRTFLAWALIAASTSLAVTACGDDGKARDFGQADASDVDASGDASDISDGGELGDGDARAPFDPADEPVTCTKTPCAVELVAGDDHFCARMSDGTARCWGSDHLGALGRGADDDAGAGGAPDAGWSVSAVQGLADVVQLSAAGATTCARVEAPGLAARVVCWGGNEHGQLGLAADRAEADGDPHPEPTPPALPRDVAPAHVAVGPRGACVVAASGALVCWGDNEQQQLARPGAEPVLAPGAAETGALTVARPVLATHTTLALTKGGEVWSWGAVGGPFGPVGGRIASLSPDPLPGKVAGLANVSSLAVSSWVEDFESPEPGPPRAHACAIAGGDVHCWGHTYRGALCTGVPDSERTPAHAPTHTAAWPQQVAVSDELSCVRMTDGTVRCCGEDARGRLGTGKVRLLASGFVQATAFTGHAVRVATSNGAVCALVQGGTVECWGSNANGELGQPEPDELDHPSPLPVRF
ncbi:MAG: hypothetical protein KF894_29070 [Labilithrix sp.]|nr:hypothetical protein [Labilithrix sp.]